MGTVHNLDDYRPHVTGQARCLDCNHEWVAVAPNAAEWLECHACTLMRGRFVYGCSPEAGSPVYMCPGCGNDVFHAQPAGLFCLNCGCTDTTWRHHPCNDAPPPGDDGNDAA